MPPLMFFCGFGFVWRLIMFTPLDDERGSSLGHHAQHAARACRGRLPVITSTLSFFRIGVVCSRDIHSTSGASEMIFMNRRSRSSRATGPNTRVPIGSPWSLMRTAALRSKRM